MMSRQHWTHHSSSLLALCEGNPHGPVTGDGAVTCGFPPQRASNAGLILGLHPANERRRYFETTSLIAGWAQA